MIRISKMARKNQENTSKTLKNEFLSVVFGRAPNGVQTGAPESLNLLSGGCI